VALNRIACPECGAGLKSASGFTPGQTVCCPKCETYFAVEDAAAEPSEPAAGKKPVRATSDDDYDDTPKGKKKRRDEEWSYRNSPARYAVLAVLVLVMCVLGYMLYDKKQREAEDAADNRTDGDPSPAVVPPPPPPGAVGVKMGRPPGGGGMPVLPPLPPPPPLPKKGNTGINPGPLPKQGGGGSPFDLLPGGGTAPNGAEADMLTKKYRDMLVGTWKADLGKGVTAELVYGEDGTVTETVVTPNGPVARSGKWSVTGLVGRKGIVVAWTGQLGKMGPMRLIFEDGELEHPVVGQNATGIFRKK
jgi:hypothetical protein